MTAIQQAAALYSKAGGVLASDLMQYLKYGYVDVAPDRLILFRPYSRAQGVDHWLTDHGQADAWYVALAVGQGGLRNFVRLMPYRLPYVSWRRTFKTSRGDVHEYPVEKIFNHFRE